MLCSLSLFGLKSRSSQLHQYDYRRLTPAVESARYSVSTRKFVHSISATICRRLGAHQREVVNIFTSCNQTPEVLRAIDCFSLVATKSECERGLLRVLMKYRVYSKHQAFQRTSNYLFIAVQQDDIVDLLQAKIYFSLEKFHYTSLNVSSGSSWPWPLPGTKIWQ